MKSTDSFTLTIENDKEAESGKSVVARGKIAGDKIIITSKLGKSFFDLVPVKRSMLARYLVYTAIAEELRKNL